MEFALQTFKPHPRSDAYRADFTFDKTKLFVFFIFIFNPWLVHCYCLHHGLCLIAWKMMSVRALCIYITDLLQNNNCSIFALVCIKYFLRHSEQLSNMVLLVLAFLTDSYFLQTSVYF